jgi:hypothetical protein
MAKQCALSRGHKPFVFLQQVFHGGKHHSMDAEMAWTAEVLRQLQSFHSSQLLPPTFQ